MPDDEPPDDAAPLIDEASEAERKKYVEDLIRRGEAAEPDENGELPPGATHEIVKRGPDDQVQVKRRRFSIG